jgi:hypothetical protein
VVTALVLEEDLAEIAAIHPAAACRTAHEVLRLILGRIAKALSSAGSSGPMLFGFPLHHRRCPTNSAVHLFFQQPLSEQTQRPSRWDQKERHEDCSSRKARNKRIRHLPPPALRRRRGSLSC